MKNKNIIYFILISLICIVLFIIYSIKKQYYLKITNSINSFKYLSNKKILDIANYNNTEDINDLFFSYNASIQWDNYEKNILKFVSRVSSHSIPRLNNCINNIKNVKYNLKLKNFQEYINIFGNKKNSSSGIIHFIKNLNDNDNNIMDADIINPFYSSKNLDNNQSLGYEDPRIFKFQNKLWIITCFRGKNFPYKTNVDTKKFGHYLIIFPIDMSKDPILLNYKNKKIIEKNWMPFEYDNKLYIVYSIENHIILEVDIKTGICIEKYKSVFNNINSMHEIGNGAPPQKININNTEYFLGIGHIRGSINNTMIRKNFFYIFDISPPFKIKYMTFPFNLNNNFIYIEFASGLLINDKKKQIYLSYGIDDCYSRLVTIDFNTLLSFLIKV